MPRYVKSPDPNEATSSTVLPIVLGGTGSSNVTNAATKLSAVRQSDVGQPGGPLPLSSGVVNSDYFANDIDIANVSLIGPNSLLVNATESFVITNYDINVQYTLTAINGMVARSNETVTFKAGNVPGPGGFVINGKTYNLTITPPTIAKPTVVAPVHGSIGLNSIIDLTSSDFAVTGGTDTHYASNWRISTTSNFSNIVAHIENTTTNKINWTVSGLAPNTIHYVQVQHVGSYYETSNWSNSSQFTTRASYYPEEELCKLLNNQSTNGDSFAYSASLSSDGNTAVIGAYGVDGTAGDFQGAAYIYIRTNGVWTQQAQLVANDPASTDKFGYSVSISDDGNTVVISASNKTGTAGDGQGAVYLFKRTGTTWALQQKLVAADPAANDKYGTNVALSGDGLTLAVGAPYKQSTAGATQGVVYIYTYTTSWLAQGNKLVTLDAAIADQFGYSVSLSSDGSTLLASSNLKNGISLTTSGAAYIFTRSGTTWSQLSKLLPSDTASGDLFGTSVAISRDGLTALVGAAGKTGTNGTTQGAAYVFVKSGSTFLQQFKLIASNGATGDRLGTSVTLTTLGNTAIVGASCKTISGKTFQGSIYVYTRTGTAWEEKNILVSSDGLANDYFGNCVDISANGDILIVGANNKTGTGGAIQGAAYIYG